MRSIIFSPPRHGMYREGKNRAKWSAHKTCSLMFGMCVVSIKFTGSTILRRREWKWREHSKRSHWHMRCAMEDDFYSNTHTEAVVMKRKKAFEFVYGNIFQPSISGQHDTHTRHLPSRIMRSAWELISCCVFLKTLFLKTLFLKTFFSKTCTPFFSPWHEKWMQIN